MTSIWARMRDTAPLRPPKVVNRMTGAGRWASAILNKGLNITISRPVPKERLRILGFEQNMSAKFLLKSYGGDKSHNYVYYVYYVY